MLAAIYARRSKEQKDRADEAKAVPRQIENARAFAAKVGWTVHPTHIYKDDGFSGAEFERRPGLQQLLAMLPRPPFQRLIVSEQKSIGREMAETMYVVKKLAEAGVEIFEYMHGRSLTPKGYLEKMMAAMQSGVDEGHREQTSERMTEAHTYLHKAGRVVGGRVFGYKNDDVFKGVDNHDRPLRSHVQRLINPTEAAVVRRIFELYDSGYGLKRIVKQLRSEGAAFPKPFARKDGIPPMGGWSPSTIRGVLSRELYHGVAVWNRTRKRNISGKWAPTGRPETDWIRVPAEHLRLIAEPLWRRVQARRKEIEGRTLRFEDGRMSGGPPKHGTPNLLAGLATCGLCGGGLVVETGGKKRGRKPEYICHRARATGSCTNKLRMSVAEMNEAVLQTIEAHALTPEAIEQVVLLSERDDAREQHGRLQRERQDVEKRIARLVTAVELATDVTSLAAKLRELEARRTAIDGELHSLHPVPRLAPAVIENRLAEWRRLLRQSTTQGRAVLQRVLHGRITFTPADGGYAFEASTRFDRLFTGLVVDRPAWLPKSTRGAEHIGSEDTFDGDYGRLLAASWDGVCARRESNPRPTGSKPVALSI
jgi:site-specific DNA recombinase